MLSFKDWSNLCENSYTLGITQPQNLGVVSSLHTLEELIAERKKMKKKMLDDKVMGPTDDDEEDETGDGEMVEPSAIKDKPKDDGDDMGDDGDDDGDDHGDENGDDEPDMDDNGKDADPLRQKIMMMKKKMKKKMCGKTMKKKMKAEATEDGEKMEAPVENEFLKSLADIYAPKKSKNWSGLAEDALFPATNANDSLVQQEPKAGEIGYAPQGIIAQM